MGADRCGAPRSAFILRRRYRPCRRGGVCPIETRLTGALDGREVDVDDVVDVLGIAAGHADRDRNARSPKTFEHVRIAGTQACLAETEKAQPVAFERIGARQVDRGVRAAALDRLDQRTPERLQLYLVARSIGQRDIEIAARLQRRVIARGVDREREDIRIARADFGRAVALMHIEIDDQHGPNTCNRLCVTRCDHRIIEDTVAAAARMRRMMGAAGQIDRDAVTQRIEQGRTGCTGRAPTALDHGL